MLAEIREQPAVLQRVLDRCARASDLGHTARSGRLHFVGCGDMYFAACQTEATARSVWGLDVRAWRSMDMRWVHGQLGAGDVVVCASVSGRTPRTLEAALLAKRAGARVVGITDNPGSPLEAALEECLLLGTAEPNSLADGVYAGYRHHIAQTQTYTALLAAELWMAACAVGETAAIDGLPARLASVVADSEPRIAMAAGEFFAGGTNVAVLGSGPHLPAARYGAAKFLEFAVPATAQCLEEFNHLECFVADEGTRALLIAMDDASFHRATEVCEPWREIGIRSAVVTASGDVPGAAWAVPLSAAAGVDRAFAIAAVLQLSCAHGVAALGRDPVRWLGGRRANLVQNVVARTIRGSRLFGVDPP